MKHLFASVLLCFCLTTSAAARHYNNDWRSMPFIEMMVTMMKVMNQVLGGSNSFAGMNALPYSPAFVPGMANGMNSLGAFNNFPMSPGGSNALPLRNTVNPLLDSFQTGQNSRPFSARSSSNFWDPKPQNNSPAATNAIVMIDNNSMNGIWQALSGDVIAIYNNNRFIWSDGGAKNLAGHLAIKGNNMIAYIPSKKMTLYFQFYMEPGQFVVRDQNARVYTFKRIH